MQAGNWLTRWDEAILYGAAGLALAATLVGAGGASRLMLVGVLGALLIVLGTLVSWRTRQESRAIAVLAGGVLALSASAVFLFVFRFALGRQGGDFSPEVYLVSGDIGGLRMGVLLVAMSFLLLRREIILFSFVPALSIFGLIGGRGEDLPVIIAFLVFLVAALVTLAHGMLLSGMRSETRSEWRRLWEERRTHWMGVGMSVLAIVILAAALYLPLSAYSSRYRFRLPVSAIGGKIQTVVLPRLGMSGGFPVGRGPVKLSEAPVLTVWGDPAELWRGEVFDTYTGGSWEKSAAEALQPHDGQAAEVAPPSSPSSGRVLRNVVRAERELPFVVYGPGKVRAVRARPPLRLPSDLRIDRHGSLTAPGEMLPRGGSYEVVSIPFDGGMASQRGGGRGDEGTAPSGEMSQQLLAVPLSARRVASLAREVAGNEPTPERKLQALVAHLRRNYVYTTRAPRTPRGKDAVDYFLFHQKRGYCDLFATALALMARTLDIPTRVVTGYAGGEREGDGAGYVLREADAHAWVEAYVPSRGWVSVDATPDASAEESMSALKRAAFFLRFFVYDHPFFLGTAAVLALAAAGIVARSRRQETRVRRQQTGDPRAAVIWVYGRLCRWLGRRGNVRRPAQTALEFLSQLEAAAPAGGPGARECLPFVRGITEAFVQARYAPGPVTEELARQVVQAWERARRCSWRRAGRK